jgi:DNA-binding GntR family transcriptional regulator
MSWSPEDLDEVFHLRALLESYGTQLAASRIDEAQLATLDELAERMIRSVEDAGTLDRITGWNNEFHALIITASGNRQLGTILASLLHLPLIHRTFNVYSTAALRRSLYHHREIVEALRAQGRSGRDR